MPRPEQPPAVETAFSLERWLDEQLENQYRARCVALNEAGLLDIPSDIDCMRSVITGIDGKEYPIPTVEAIREEFLRNREIYAAKMRQGFIRLQLTPIALPLARLNRAYRQQLIKHHREGRLFYPPKNPGDQSEQLIAVKSAEFDESNPFFVWDALNNADTDGSLIYYPKRFDSQNHGGVSKAKLLIRLAFPGWLIGLNEENPNIPRQGRGKTIGDRKQLEAGLSPIECQEKFTTDSTYANESGQTAEEAVIYALTELHDKGQVTDDYFGHGSVNWCTGNYHLASGVVPNFCWDRVCRRACLDGSDPRLRSGNFGVRPAVRVGKIGI